MLYLYLPFFISLIIYTPPPPNDPIYEPYIYPTTLVKNENESYNSILEETMQYIDKVNVVINFRENKRRDT